MNLVKTTIRIGLPAPVRVLHLSDTHFCKADDHDPEHMHAHAASRLKGAFLHNGEDRIQEYWDEAVAYAQANSMPILHTGDLIDFLTHGCGAHAQKMLENIDCFFAMGNHELCHQVGKAREDHSYKMEQLPVCQPFFKDPLLFASRVIGGVNFVAVDNGYYLFTDWQTERLKYEVSKGFPVILMMHNPIHTDALYDVMMNEKKQPCAYLVGTPTELMQCYPEHRYNQQLADAPTNRFIEYISHEPAIRAILAGHLHFNWEGELPWGIMQYVTGGGFLGDAREIEIL